MLHGLSMGSVGANVSITTAKVSYRDSGMGFGVRIRV